MKTFFARVVILLVLIIAGVWLWRSGLGLGPVGFSPSPTASVNNQSISDGTITVSYQGGEFGLATTPGQILVNSYIPPCDSNFDYCLYYNGSAYRGTNFESAGLRIKKRTDLSAERLCLNAPPEGFSATTTPAATASTNTYSTSVFSPVGDAAAGHFSKGSLYRLYLRGTSTCYEFETRVGQSQFQNYPSGTIKEFTAADQANVEAKLRSILNTVTLKNGERVMFPQP
jgi:hypothetical protein